MLSDAIQQITHINEFGDHVVHPVAFFNETKWLMYRWCQINFNRGNRQWRLADAERLPRRDGAGLALERVVADGLEHNG